MIYLAIGWLMVGLGVVGAVLPIMPTVPFLLVAAAAFARSSPELEAKLMSHPRFGVHLRQWRHEGAIALPAKVLAVTAMAISFTSVMIFGAAYLWLQATIGMVLLASAIFVITRPQPALVRENA
ncbi:YbaN family protein [Martelella endophytica]|uniref:Membrane protein n=1 Tax=Martelella endophytica TaxID=1486262 RepID=A0A0D5LQE3_MAREN|nr:YbaN family protein [Martelella endophytica]AJY46419.1 membrane protein [Martelella endophytica]